MAKRCMQSVGFEYMGVGESMCVCLLSDAKPHRSIGTRFHSYSASVMLLPASFMFMLDVLLTILMMIVLVYEYALYNDRTQVMDACRWSAALIIPLIPLVVILDGWRRLCGLTA